MKITKMFLPLLLAVSLSGCSNYTKAQKAYNVVEAIISVVEADLPSLQAAGVFSPAEATVVGGYANLAGHLADQYESCITNAQNTMIATSGKFLDCLNVFSAGLADPKELASLRVLNPKAQKQVQLWVTAVQVGINATIAVLGGQQTAPVAISASLPTTAELHEFGARCGYQGGY